MSYNQDILNISELYGHDDNDLPDIAYPICYHDIDKSQKNDAKLQQTLVSRKDYTLDTFRGGEKKPSFNMLKYQYMLTNGTTKENCILVSRDALSSWRDLHRAFYQSKFRLERPSHNIPQSV